MNTRSPTQRRLAALLILAFLCTAGPTPALALRAGLEQKTEEELKTALNVSAPVGLEQKADLLRYVLTQPWQPLTQDLLPTLAKGGYLRRVARGDNSEALYEIASNHPREAIAASGIRIWNIEGEAGEVRVGSRAFSIKDLEGSSYVKPPPADARSLKETHNWIYGRKDLSSIMSRGWWDGRWWQKPAPETLITAATSLKDLREEGYLLINEPDRAELLGSLYRIESPVKAVISVNPVELTTKGKYYRSPPRDRA